MISLHFQVSWGELILAQSLPHKRIIKKLILRTGHRRTASSATWESVEMIVSLERKSKSVVPTVAMEGNQSAVQLMLPQAAARGEAEKVADPVMEPVILMK
jgi:hypothetical protein